MLARKEAVDSRKLTVDEEDDGSALGAVFGFRDVGLDAADCFLAAFRLSVLDLA